MSLLNYFHKQRSQSGASRSTNPVESNCSSPVNSHDDSGSGSDYENEVDCVSRPKWPATKKTYNTSDNPDDIGNIFGRRLSSDSNYQMMKCHYDSRPSPKYSFPK
uniref:Uncharacterized protein n=1 Tax=Amphimedon queenslandica TaxID=400682 RepID=A0A1X7TU90_AMPQE